MVEAHRLARAARWLLDAKPQTAAVRAREAVVAALNARAADGGELYFAASGRGEKLKVLGDHENLRLLRTVLTPADPRERVPFCLDAVERLVGPAGTLHTVLRWATGAGATELDDRTVRGRWQLRALEVRRLGLPAADSDGVVWSGAGRRRAPRGSSSLFTHNMVWLGVAHPAPEVPREHSPTTVTGDTATGPADASADLRRLLTFRGHGAARLLLGCGPAWRTSRAPSPPDRTRSPSSWRTT
ncbi:hypothetical protein GCM10023238_22400 [Streptomyces heliomycini]